MSSLLSITLCLLLIMSSLPSHASPTPPKTTTILLFGDSIIAGYGLAETETLSVQLEHYLTSQKHDVKVINAGVSGDTTSAGLNRLAWTLKRNNPDIVVLALGGNDVLRGLNLAVTRQNLDAMLKILQDAKVRVIVSKVPDPSNLGANHSTALKNTHTEIAQKYDVPLYPFLLQDIYSTQELMLPDGIHPSAAGVVKIAKPLGDYLIEFLRQETP